MDRFGARLKAARERKKRRDPRWTQDFMANKVGVARSTYTGYENGTKEPPLDTLNRIADELEVSVDYLMGRSPDTQPTSTGAQLLLDLIALPEEEAVRKMQEHFVWDGQPVSDEKAKDILRFARFRTQQE